MLKTPSKEKTKRSTAKSDQLWELQSKFVSKSVYHYHKIALESGDGAVVRDVDGNEYIDFAGGIGVMNVGHRHPAVVAALHEAVDKLHHACYQVNTYESYIKLAERLCKIAPGKFDKKAVFFNSGAEAVENAVKAAKSFTKRSAVIGFDMGFSGRTYMALSLTGKESYRKGLGPMVPDVYHTPYPYAYRPPQGVSPENLTDYCLSELKRIFASRVAAERVAAVIIEPVQGEGGFIVPTPGFLPGLRELCDKHGIVLIMDEIQSGMGRTGSMWACEQLGATGDLMTTAKSIASGLPLSGIVGRADVLDAAPAGALGGTYGGNPIACAAALAVLDVYEKEDLLGKGRKIGAALEKRFDALKDKYPFVGDSRGLGPMRALELVKDKKTKEPITSVQGLEILNACAERGLLMIKAGQYDNVLRCLVPLTATEAQIHQGVDILDTVLSQFKA